MTTIRRTAFAALFLALFSVPVHALVAGTTYYADVVGGPWEANTTWHLVSNSGPVAPAGTYPGSAAGDTAIMDFQGEVVTVTTVIPNAVTLNENNVSMFVNVNAGGVLPLTGSSLVGSSAVLVLNGGTLTNSGTLDIQPNSGLTLTAGTFDGSGTTNIAFDASLPALLTIAGGTLDTQTINVNGKAKYTGSWTMNNGATVAISATGVFDVQSIGEIFGSGGAQINNAGLFQKTSGAGGTNIVPPLNNNNLVKVMTGDLVMNGTHTAGTFDIASGSKIELAGTINGSCIGQGAGEINIVNALTIDAGAQFALTNIKMSGGVLQGPVSGTGTAQISGAANFVGGTWTRNLDVDMLTGSTLDFPGIAAATISSDAHVVNDGTINVTAGAGLLAIDSGGHITNDTTINLVGDVTLNSDSVNNARIDNIGGASIFKTAGAGIATFNVSLNNDGDVKSLSGDMKFTRSGAHTGTFWICDACTFDFAGGTHTLDGALIRYINFNAGAIARLTGATFDVPTSAQVDANDFFQTAGTITGAGSFAIFANYTWSGGSHTGTGDTQLASFTHTFNGANSAMLLDGRDMLVNGTVTYAPVAANYLTINSNSRLNIPGGYTFTMTTDAPILSDGTGEIYNQGTFQKTGGSGKAQIAAIFNNSGSIILVAGHGLREQGLFSGGTLNVASGQVALNGGGTNNGNLFVPNAANIIAIEANTYYFDAGTVTNPADLGGFSINGGELSLGVAMVLKNVELLSGTLSGADLTISNKLKWTGGTNIGSGNTTTIASTATLSHLAPTLPTYLDNRTLLIDGTADYEGNGLQLTNGAAIDIAAGAFMNLRDGAILNGAGVNTITNDGTLRKIAGTTGMRFDVPVTTNAGTVSSEVSGQSLIFANGGTLNAPGTLTTTSGALIDFFTGTFDVNGGTLSGAGQLRVNGGTLKINTNTSATTTVAVDSGIVQVPSPITFQMSTLLFTGGSLQDAGVTRPLAGSIGSTAPTSLSGGHTLTIAGSSFDYNADNVKFLTISDTSKLNVENGATFAITGDSVIGGASPASLTNSGTVRKTAGAGVARIDVPVTSSGTSIGSISGILRLNGGGTITSAIEAGAGATVAFTTGSFFVNAGASISGSGTISVQSGTVDVSTALTIPSLALSGGTLTGSGALTLNNASWSGGDLSGGSASVAGTMTITTTAAKNLGRVLTNNGTVDLQDGNIGGGGSLTNNGTFNRSTTGSAVSFAPTFTNAANVNLLTGSIAFTSYTQSAGITNLAGGNMSSASSIAFNGGLLKGIGTITGNVTNAATVAPGTSPGVITIAGNYSQTPSGVLNLELGGTAPGSGYDRLAVTGSATFAGTVNVTLINSFTLSSGDVFDVVTYSAHSGIFSTENLPPFPGGTFSSAYTSGAYELVAAVPSASDVGVTKSGPATAKFGDIISYTIVVKNFGTSSVTNVIVNDPVPQGLLFRGNGGDCTTAFPCALGTLAAGATRTIVASYKVDLSGSGGPVTNTATLNVTDPNNSNNSASATTLIACPNIAATNLEPSGTGGTSGTLTWSHTNAELYQVFLGPKGSGCSTPFGKTIANSLAYSGLLPNTEYEWRVESSFDGCPVQSSSCVAFTTDACPVPEAPLARVIGEATSAKSYDVEWDIVPNAVRYEVDEATDAAFSDAVTTVVNQGLNLAFNHESAQPKGYYYRVRALTDCSSNPGPYSIPIRVVIVPPPGPTEKNPSFNIPVGSQDLINHKVFIPGEPNQTQFYTATADREWIFVTPPTGALPPQGVTLDVLINPHELPNGTFTATIIVNISGGTSGGVTTNGNTVSIPISVNLVTPVTPVSSKSGPSQYSLIVPAVGHLKGIDSAWESDVRLTNAGFRAYKYRLTFTTAAGTAAGLKTTDVTVDAGGTMALDDIVRNWYGFGSLGDGESGTLEIVPLDDPANASLVTVASSRTYNLTQNGTLGQFVPAVPFPSFIGKAASGGFSTILSLQQLAQSNAFRTNVGVVEGAGKSASAIISIFNAGGTKLLDLPQALLAGQQLQLNGLLAANGITLDDGRIEVRVTGGDGKVTAYASVVDNGTGDPLLVSGMPLTQSGATRYVLPGAANTNTGFADWRTDMRIFNYGTVPQTATLTFFPIGGGAPRTAEVLAKVGEVLALDNVVKNLFNGVDLGGAVHVTTPQPASFIVSGRTYNQGANGTFGQFIPAVTVEQGIAAGGRSLNILQIEDSPRFRTNIGVTELSGKPAVVELQIVLPDTKITPIVEVPLAANESRQFNVIRDLNLGNVYNARISVRVKSGEGRVTAYGSLIDELTGDPAFIPGQ